MNDTIEQVKRIDKLTWKDRVKQYTIQSVITIGLMLMIFGVYTLINLLI
ncbi:MAG: hypothetical protein SOY09_16695 [Clostridium sp.]|nr:hypothetical protein [Clostridium sp.]